MQWTEIERKETYRPNCRNIQEYACGMREETEAKGTKVTNSLMHLTNSK
jgi:hypothetical protein